MADATLNPMLQEFGTGSDVALALKMFSGSVITAYQNNLVFAKHAMKQFPTQGSSIQFPATAKATAENHTAGTELQGNNQPVSEERTVVADDKEIVAHRYFNDVHNWLSHFDTRNIAAQALGQAVAREVDGRAARQIIIGARQTVRNGSTGDTNDQFPAGNRVVRDGSLTVATAYPASLTGSKRIQSDLEQLGQLMDEDNVPDGSRMAIMSPFLRRVLLLDKTLVSTDYQSPNDLFVRRLVTVAGFFIEFSNLIPSADDRLNTSIPATYRADFSGADDVGLPQIVAIGDIDALGQAIWSNGGILPFGPTWVPDKLSWLQGARMFQGSKWLRPEACGEIALTSV